MLQFVRTFERTSLTSLVEAIEATMVEQNAKVVATAPLASHLGYHAMLVVFERLVP